MILTGKTVFTLRAIRILSRFFSRIALAALVLAFSIPFASASGEKDLTISPISPGQSMESTGDLNLARHWNRSNAEANPPHHFPNLLVELTCFGWCAAEKDHQAWLGDHADTSVFGRSRDMEGSTAVNAHMVGYRYALLWYTLDDSHRDPDNIEDKWQRDLAHWAAGRGLDVEEFYLHTAVPTTECVSPARTRACRLNSQWGVWGTQWYGNLGNPHFVEYTRDRAQRMLAGHNGLDESIFWDTMDSGGLRAHACGDKAASLEYGASCELYEKHLVQLVVQVRDALGGRRLQVNTASYTSAVSPFNGWIAIAAGSTHTEGLNTPFHEYSDAWNYVDEMLDAGVKVAFASHSYAREDELLRLGQWAHWKTGYSGGNYGSGLRRYQMTTLAQHYLLTPNHLSGNFYWNPNPDDWTVAFGKQWIPAVEVDLGKPIDARRVLASTGYDGAGQDYDLYRREFSHAFVYARPMKTWKNTAYDDSSAIQIQLPEENLSLLNPDGLSAPIIGKSIWLRNGEGVILLRNGGLASGSRGVVNRPAEP